MLRRIAVITPLAITIACAQNTTSLETRDGPGADTAVAWDSAFTLDSGARADSGVLADAVVPRDAGIADAASDVGHRWDARADAGIARPDAFVIPDVPVVRPDATTHCPGTSTPPAPVCGDAGLCGNGVRNECTVCSHGLRPFPDAGPTCVTHREECDGQDLGGRTCRAIGYASGPLECGPWCGFDTSKCVSCAGGAHVSACVHPEVGPVTVRGVALAAGHGELALAWIVNGGSVRLARYRPDLSLIGVEECAALGAEAVAVAASVNGWMVVTEASGWLELTVDDLATGVRSRRRLVGRDPILVPVPAAAPLLLYTRANTLYAARLRPNGSDEWLVAVVSNPTEPELSSGVYTGDGFLVAARAQGVRVVRIELDGSVSGMQSPAGGSTEYPQIGWTGTEARLVYADFGGTPSVIWMRLDRAGITLGQPVVLGQAPTYFNPSPIVTSGDDTIVLLGRYTGSTARAEALDVARIGPQGSTLVAPQAIEMDPKRAFSYRIVTLGAYAYAAWAAEGFPGRVGLARLSL